MALGSGGTADGSSARHSGVSRQGFLRRAGLLQLLAVKRTVTFNDGHQVGLQDSESPVRDVLCPTCVSRTEDSVMWFSSLQG